MENKVLESLQSTYRVILDKISINASNKGLVDVRDRLKQIFNYNVGNGKGLRALFVVKTFILLAKHKGIVTTEEDIELAQILGAGIEIMHAFALICDDIMDQSSTRRGRPCWYKQVQLYYKGIYSYSCEFSRTSLCGTNLLSHWEH